MGVGSMNRRARCLLHEQSCHRQMLSIENDFRRFLFILATRRLVI